jgi:hypothetical protein
MLFHECQIVMRPKAFTRKSAGYVLYPCAVSTCGEQQHRPPEHVLSQTHDSTFLSPFDDRFAVRSPGNASLGLLRA